jgi:hypothetical protein
VKVDYYGVKNDGAAWEPDLERDLVRADAVARAKIGDVVLVKVWLRSERGRPADLERVEAAIAEAVKPLGLK